MEPHTQSTWRETVLAKHMHVCVAARLQTGDFTVTSHQARHHGTVPADVRLDLLLGHGHHGDGCGCGEPVGFVVAAGVVADLVGGAVEEGDGAEPGEAGPRLTWRHREERENTRDTNNSREDAEMLRCFFCFSCCGSVFVPRSWL